MKLVAAFIGPMALAVLFGVVGNLCAILIPVAGAVALLCLLGLVGDAFLVVCLTLMALAAVMRSACRYGEQHLNHYIAFSLLAHIRDQVFSALRRLAPAKLEGRDKGSLITLITTDIELLEVFYAHTVSPVAIAVLVSAVLCLFVGMLHPLFALIAAASYLVVGAALPALNGRITRQRGQLFREEFADLNSLVFDSLRGIAQSVQYGEGTRRRLRLAERGAGLARCQERLKQAEGRSFGLTDAVVFLASVLMLVAGVLLQRQGLIGFDAVLLSSVALISSFGPVIALSALSNNLAQTFASANRVFSLMDEQPVVTEVAHGVSTGFTGIEMRKVTFGYEAATAAAAATAPDAAPATGAATAPVLNDFSLEIAKGQVIGLSGPSGSGKSTILKLLMRFWDVDAGSITLSGEDLRILSTDCLRTLQGYMTQDTQLFDDTLLNNLLIVRPDASAADVEKACRAASLHEFIQSLPQGYETTVGELGERLSGGERQRLGLARVFLYDPPLILLDEPTSNLDSLNEAVILKSLYERARGATVVLVSHRRSTMRLADRVYTVSSGRLS
ncbi:MAG: ABC transporter ATP-binding protein/permease [Coriobacteriales bacterium]|nr:ABC transporter ATP-binding protein/permease [Coriobacteriales bacterium]